MMPIGPPQRLSREDVHKKLVCFAGCVAVSGGEAGETARVIADFLRHGLCYLGSEDDTRTQAVHVHQLLAVLRRQLSGWLPELDLPPWVSPEEARPAPTDEEPDAAAHFGVKDLGLHVLRKLELLGDCGHRGGGYYLATPARLVCLPSGAALVVGGLATAEMPSVLGGLRPAWAGLARALPADTAARVPATILRQNLAAWAGIPKESLETWTARLLDEAANKAAPTAGFDPASFEIYAPHLQPNQGQRHRWVSPRAWRRASGKSDAPWSLCRTRARPYRFWLAPLLEDTHGARYRREWAVRPEWARRLLYGMDQLCGHPVTARVYPVSEGVPGERELRLYSWPAWEEYRVLCALAYDSTPPEGPHLPIRFRVASAWWPDIRPLLDGLGVRIRDEASPTQ